MCKKIDPPIILTNTSIALLIDLQNFSTFCTLSIYFTNPAFFAIIDNPCAQPLGLQRDVEPYC